MASRHGDCRPRWKGRRQGRPAFVALMLVLAGPAAADAAAARCLPITDDALRLACYDRALGRPASTAAPPSAGDPAEVQPPLSPAAAQQADSAAAAAPASRAAGEAKPATPAVADAFGKESVKVPVRPDQPKEPERIEARVVGAVDGPARGQLLVLDNGQRWQVIDDREFSVIANDPPVALWRNLIGSYWLRFEPSGPQLRVRRVK